MNTCKHQRTPPCPYCLCQIRPDHYWEMIRWQNELRRKGKRRAA